MSAKKLLIGLIVVVLAAGLVAANLYYRRDDALEVAAEAIRTRDLEAIVSASGKIQPKLSVDISANTMGEVTAVAVNEGERVRPGQFLLQIDARTLETAVQRSEAAVMGARSGLEAARVAIETAEANLDRARRSLARQQDLWKDELTTRETLEQAQTEVTIRETDLRARQQEVSTREEQIKQEEANLESNRYDLTKVRLVAPIEGLVTRRNIDEGETVVVGTMNNAGTVLMTIADMSVIQAEVEVDETDVPDIDIGQQAVITIDALPNREFAGRVTEIGNSPIQAGTSQGTGSQATNFKVVVVMDGEIPSTLRPGFTCTAEITTAVRPQVLAVPIQAVTVRELEYDAAGQRVEKPRDDDRRRRRADEDEPEAELPPGHTREETEGVFLIRNGEAIFQPIEVGIVGERYFEVLSGLQSGDVVITGPYASVRDLAEGDAVKREDDASN